VVFVLKWLKGEHKRIAVFGCGNPLFGDDGFGGAVIEKLSQIKYLPPGVLLEDVGTGIREVLFAYLLDPSLRPRKIVIVDAASQQGRRAGEVFLTSPSEIPHEKLHDFSLHQFPTVNMLSELANGTGTEVMIVAVQPESIPESVCPGLSQSVAEAVPLACSIIKKIIFNESEAR